MPENRKPTDKLIRQKRLMISPAEEKSLDKLVARLAETLDTPVRMSHVLWACLQILHHAEPQILGRAASTRLTRPPNEMADVLGDFERRLARLLLVSFKESSRFG